MGEGPSKNDTGSKSRLRLGAARRRAILKATVQLLAEVGYDRLTVDAVAAHARASKATIYRHWSDKAELVAEAVKSGAFRAPCCPEDTGSLRGDLLAMVHALTDTVASDLPLLAGLLLAMQNDPELAAASRAHIVDAWRQIGRQLIARARGRGELSPHVALDLVPELAPALVLMRLLITAQPVNDQLVASVVDDLLVPLLTRGPLHEYQGSGEKVGTDSEGHP